MKTSSKTKRLSQIPACTLVLTGLLLSSQPTAAAFFEPTTAEWRAWPPYCQAKLPAVSDAPPSEITVDPTTVKYWTTALGENNFLHIHHFCKALVVIERAKAEMNPQVRAHDFVEAEDDASFSYARTSLDCPIYGEIATTLARAKAGRGKTGEAIQILNHAIEVQPSNPAAYMALALLLKQQNNLSEARRVLERGDSASGGTSAELNYFLGLIALRLGDLDAAEKHARIAYSLGYPLPALKNDLRKRGRWPSD